MSIQLKSEKVIVSAPTSFSGSAARIWKITESDNDLVKWLVLVPIATACVLSWVISGMIQKRFNSPMIAKTKAVPARRLLRSLDCLRTRQSCTLRAVKNKSNAMNMVCIEENVIASVQAISLAAFFRFGAWTNCAAANASQGKKAKPRSTSQWPSIKRS